MRNIFIKFNKMIPKFNHANLYLFKIINSFKNIFINYYIKIKDMYYILNNTNIINEHIQTLNDILNDIKTYIIHKINNFIIIYNTIILDIILQFNKVKINNLTLLEINNGNLYNLIKFNEYIIYIMDEISYELINLIFIFNAFINKINIKLLSHFNVLQNYIFNKPIIIYIYNILTTNIDKFIQKIKNIKN